MGSEFTIRCGGVRPGLVVAELVVADSVLAALKFRRTNKTADSNRIYNDFAILDDLGPISSIILSARY